MEEQIISFETAKLAHDLKLYIPSCRRGYNGDETCYDLKRPNRYYETCSIDSGPNYSDRLMCCTQAVLQKWFREEYNIDVYVIPGSITGYDCYVGINNYGSYSTYEESLEVALQEGLKKVASEKK